MKVKDLINKLKNLDEDADIFYLEEIKETGEDFCFYFAVCENQIKHEDKHIERYYTLEKRD